MSESSTNLIESTACGFWRRIRLQPGSGQISAGLEDDFHHFLLQMRHADGVIVGIKTRGVRIPWSTCADAGEYLAEQLIGQPLIALAEIDPRSHCTHLFELLLLCVAHAGDSTPTQLDLHVPDRQQARTCATLHENGRAVLHWQLDGTRIEEPDTWAGRDLRQLSEWRSSLTAIDAERAMLLRRVVHISGGRTSRNLDIERASDRGPSRMGACFTYQMPRALEALRTPDWVRDFSRPGAAPLSDFNADAFNGRGES